MAEKEGNSGVSDFVCAFLYQIILEESFTLRTFDLMFSKMRLVWWGSLLAILHILFTILHF